MNTGTVGKIFEITTTPIGDGWRVRIADGRRLQFVGGFEAKSDAEQWAHKSAHAWLIKLRTIVEHL